jgi:hypothetical protein
MEAPAGQQQSFEQVGLAVVVLACILPPLLIYPLPTSNGHLHVFTAFAFSELENSSLGFGAYLERNIALTGQAFVLLVVALDQLLPFAWAERVALALMLGMYPLGGALCARLTERPRLPVAAMLALLSYGWVLAMGDYNLLLGFAFIAPLVGLLWRLLRDGSRYLAGITILTLGLAWLHLFAAALAGAMMLLIAVGASRRRVFTVLRLLFLFLPAASYGLWVGWLVLSADGSHDIPAARAPLGDLFWSGPGGLSAVTGVLLLLSCALAIRTAFSNRRTDPSSALLVLLGLSLLVASAAMPRDLLSWPYLSFYVLFGAFFVLSIAAFAHRGGVIESAAIVLAVIVGILAASQRLAGMNEELESTLEAVTAAPHEWGTPLLALELNPSVPRDPPRHARLTVHLAHRLLMKRGGFSPFVDAGDEQSDSLLFLRSPRALVGPAPGTYVHAGLSCLPTEDDECEAHHFGVADRIAYYGVYWGELLLFHASDAIETRLRARGFERRFEQSGVALWVASPSALHLRLSGSQEPLASTLVVRVGWSGSTDWILGAELPAESDVSGGAVIPFQPLPAGPIDVEVFIDSNQNGEPDDEEWHWPIYEVVLRPNATTEVELTVTRAPTTPEEPSTR